MRAAIYARKSTENEDRQVQSLADQVQALQALALREGIRVVEVITEAKSAKEPGARPEFDRLLSMIREGQVEAVLTWSINRLSRNELDHAQIVYLLRTGKLACIRTVDRVYRPEDNALLLSIENGMAVAYLQDLSRTVSRGMQGKADRGWHVCKAPVGYLNDPITREIVPDPERFALVRRGWELLLSGKSVSRVHSQLVEGGLTVSSRRRARGAISKARLYTLFRDPFYMGTVRYKGEQRPGRHVSIVTEEEFAQVQDQLQRSQKPKKMVERSFPFSGTFICASCGCAVVASHKTKTYPRSGRTAHYVYYHCSGHKGCSKHGIRQEELVQSLEEPLTRASVPRSLGEWLKEALAESVERTSCTTAEELSAMQHESGRYEKRIRELTLLRLDGSISPKEYTDLRSEFLTAVDGIRNQIEAARDRAAKVLRLIYQRIDAAVRCGEELCQGNTPGLLGQIARSAGIHVLNLKPFALRMDPIFTKIAAFEPLRNGSEQPKRGDLVPLDSVWWVLVEDLRTTATGLITVGDCGCATSSKGLPLCREHEVVA
jgi:site-specific DNA recombinase